MLNWVRRFKLNRLVKKLKRYQYLREQGDQKAKVLEIQTLLQIAEFFKRQIYNPKFSLAKLTMFEYYRAAASLNDAKAQYICALQSFEVGRFYEDWFKSSYSREVHEVYMKEAYSQGFEFLAAAEANGFAEATRYKGLAYVNGWGVVRDTTQGFNFILESIEMENAWANATKIIEKLGLNSPEFFKALTQYQSKKQN